jgi:hypothetical protein
MMSMFTYSGVYFDLRSLLNREQISGFNAPVSRDCDRFKQ